MFTQPGKTVEVCERLGPERVREAVHEVLGHQVGGGVGAAKEHETEADALDVGFFEVIQPGVCSRCRFRISRILPAVLEPRAYIQSRIRDIALDHPGIDAWAGSHDAIRDRQSCPSTCTQDANRAAVPPGFR